MFIFFSNRLGCGGSLLVSAVRFTSVCIAPIEWFITSKPPPSLSLGVLNLGVRREHGADQVLVECARGPPAPAGRRFVP
jgi:hypothetical protein